MREYEKGSITSFLVVGIIILAFVVLGLFTYSISKENAKKKEVDKEILALQAQSDNIKKENMALSDRIAYLGSRDYQEMQAKDKLNLQNPGEKVVIITPSNSGNRSVSSEPQKTQEIFVNDTSPNFKKWWNYFFKP